MQRMHVSTRAHLGELDREELGRDLPAGGGGALGEGVALRVDDRNHGRKHELAEFQARHELGVAAQNDVRAAARHVGGYGDRMHAARLRHDLRLALHILRLGVEHLRAGNS